MASLLTVAVALLSPAAPKERAFALLADNEVVEVALPGSKIVERRRVGPRPQASNLEPGRMLAASDNRIFVLVASGTGSDSVAVLDARTAKLIARWPLEAGVRYRGTSSPPIGCSRTEVAGDPRSTQRTTFTSNRRS